MGSGLNTPAGPGGTGRASFKRAWFPGLWARRWPIARIGVAVPGFSVAEGVNAIALDKNTGLAMGDSRVRWLGSIIINRG